MASLVILEQCQHFIQYLLFPYLLRNLMDSDQHFLAHFSNIGFSYWPTNRHSRRFGQGQQGSDRVGDSEGRLQVGR
jgi:hypothetical protein